MELITAPSATLTPVAPAPPEAFEFTIQECLDFAATKVSIEGWRAYKWEHAEGGNIVTGCVPSGVITHGPRKGEPKFEPPTPGTLRKVIVTDEQMAARAIAYEAESRTCWNCKGERQVPWGWSTAEGMKYHVCTRCSGSGAAPAGAH